VNIFATDSSSQRMYGTWVHGSHTQKSMLISYKSCIRKHNLLFSFMDIFARKNPKELMFEYMQHVEVNPNVRKIYDVYSYNRDQLINLEAS
jgi:hypothetical protein